MVQGKNMYALYRLPDDTGVKCLVIYKLVAFLDPTFIASVFSWDEKDPDNDLSCFHYLLKGFVLLVTEVNLKNPPLYCRSHACGYVRDFVCFRWMGL